MAVREERRNTMCRGAEAARLSAEDRTRSSEDRKIAQETRVRTQRSFKFVLGRSPTPLLLPLSQGLPLVR